jgi:hypothetical protein
VALKLITQIRRWLESTPYEDLTITEHKTLSNGIYYDFKKGNFRFCLVMQDLKQGLRINWIFHRDLTPDEKEYWSGRYDFKVNGEDQITKSTLQIQDIHNHDEVKVLMSRNVETLRIFTKDLRWILVMARGDNK